MDEDEERTERKTHSQQIQNVEVCALKRSQNTLSLTLQENNSVTKS